MPNFGKKTNKGSQVKKTKTVPSAPVEEVKKPRADNTVDEGEDRNIIDEIAVNSIPEAHKISPFVDGLVSARLNGLVIIPRVGGEEVELLRGFLRHFSTAAPFAGNIVSKTSFMRKKGGRLL